MRSFFLCLFPIALASHATLQAFLKATFPLPRMAYDAVSNTVCYDYPLVNECANSQEIEWVTNETPPADLTTWVPASEQVCSDLLDLEMPYLTWVAKEVFGEGNYHADTATGDQQDIPWVLLHLANVYHYYNLYYWGDWTSVLKNVDWSGVSCDSSNPIIMTSALGTHAIPQAIQDDCDQGSAVCRILCSFGSP